jgi:hypothetical protein
MASKVEKYLEVGNIEGAKSSIVKELLAEDKAKFYAAMQEEYDLLFPLYYPTEQEFVFTSYEDDMQKWREAKELDGFEVTLFDTEKRYTEYRKAIDYSEDETYLTFTNWLNETRVITEAVEATYDEDGMILTEAVAEATKLVRPYTPIEVTDEMIQVELDKLGYVPKEVQEAKQYLVDTDWYIIRKVDSGVEVPEEIIAKRVVARALI